MTRRLKSYSVKFVALLTLWALQSYGNDTLVTLGAGGLIPAKSTSIRMVSEDLSISVATIRVKYVFRNESNEDIDAVVAFPLPDLSGAELSHEPIELPSKRILNFIDFRVFVGSVEVKPKYEIKALDDKGRDISSRLRSIGLPLLTNDPGFQKAVEKLPAAIREQLIKEELVDVDETSHSVTGPFVKEYWQNWRSRVQFYWKQHFPSNQEITVEHTYRPVVGGNYITRDDDAKRHIEPYCGGPNELAKIRKIRENSTFKDSSDLYLVERRVEYILRTANNWNGPIQRFHLSVRTGNSENILATCMPGLKQTGPSLYETIRTDYRPDRDLQVLILQRKK